MHLPPATSRGPFFFFSSCTASANSLPPFFSRAEPARGERTKVNASSHTAARKTASKKRADWWSCRQTGRQTHNRQWCCQSFPPASLWISALTFIIKHTCSCYFNFKSLGKSHKWSVRIQSCHFQNDSFWELN